MEESNLNAYELAQKRVEFLFSEFDNILVSFSGGKDSTVCLHLFYDWAREHNALEKLAMYHLDYEAQYQMTTDYVEEVFNSFSGIRKYWLCLPILAQCACSIKSKGHWIPWEKDKKDIWVRKMPDSPYLVSEDNAAFPFKGMTDKECQDSFADWFKEEYGRTAVIVGIRDSESHDRWMLTHSINGSLGAHRYKGKVWSVDDYFYPIYDWSTEDVWTYLGKFHKSYNKLYDLYYKAGLTIDQMRVASPFNNCATATLKLYKVIDPNNWGKMIGRVDGVNFAGLYGGTTAFGWRSIKLPQGHTWKSYCYFLLSTLDEDTRKHYERILATSIEYWCEKGGFVSDEIMPELEEIDVVYQDEGYSPRFKNQKVLKFKNYPDDMDTKSFAKLPSYKRMCVCILKNDYYCKYMGFGLTKEAIERRKKTLERYKNL